MSQGPHKVIFHPVNGLPLGCEYCGAVPPSTGFTTLCPVNIVQQPEVYAPPRPSVHTLHIDEIPAGLLEDETKSNSASTMFSSEEVKVWFRNLINASELDFNHPNESDYNPHAPRNFEAYIPKFLSDGFKVWDVQKSPDANTRLVLEAEGRYATISGRPDFLICDGNAVLGNYLQHTRGIVEVQSNPDEERCELQLMVCM